MFKQMFRGEKMVSRRDVESPRKMGKKIEERLKRSLGGSSQVCSKAKKDNEESI